MLIDLVPRAAPQAIELNPPPLNPSFLDELGAAFRLNNPAASMTTYKGPYFDEASQYEPGFDIQKELVGTKYEPYLDQAWHLMNRSATEKWKLQVDREEEDRKIYNASGFTGTGLGFVASILDPSIMLPGGALVKGAKGYSLLKSALLTGTAGAGAMGLQEAALQSSQETRTGTESAFAIGGGFLLGSLLGAGGAALLSRVEARTMARGLDDVANRVIPDEQAANESLLRNAVGAASAPELTLEDLTPVGRAAQAMAIVGSWVRLNVASRLMTYSIPYARELGMTLAGNHVYLKMFERGGTLGTSINQAVKRWTQSSEGFAGVNKALREGYKSHRKSGGALTRRQFDEAVGAAQFRNRESSISEVQAVAQTAGNLDDRMFKAAQEVGWNPHEQTEDPSHGMYIWRRPVIEANEAAFKVQAAGGYEEMAKAAVNKRNDTRMRHVARLQQRVADLSTSPEDAAKLVQALPKQILALQSANPQHEATRNALRKLIGQRNRAPSLDIKRALNYEIKDLKAKAGVDYTSYVTGRAALKSRFANIRKSVGAGANKEDAVRDQILDSAMANITTLEKLHATLTKLDQRALDESPEEYLATLSKARTDFATLLEKNNNLEVKLAKTRAEAEVAKREAASVAQPAMEARKEKLAQQLVLKQTTDQKQIEQLTERALRIEELEAGDPEAASRELQELMRTRMEQSAGKIEKEAFRIGKLLGERPAQEAADKITSLNERIGRTNSHFEDLVGPSGGYLKDGNLAMSDVDLKNYAMDMAKNLFDHVTGRVEPESDFEITPVKRGVLRHRIVSPGFERMKDYLDTRISEMMRRQTRRTGADIELRRRFGSATLTAEIQRMKDQYEKLRATIDPTDTKRLMALGNEQRRAERDIEALRDMLRGTYLARERSTPAARILSGIAQINFMRALGGVLIANVTDTVRPAMVMGLRPFMKDGLAPLMRGLRDNLNFAKAVEDSHLAGIGTEREVHSRIETLAGLRDPFDDRTPVENMLEHLSNAFAKATGLVIFTDYMKNLTSVMLQQRIVREALAGKMTAHSALIGLNERDLQLIAEQFNRYGFTDEEGFMVSNTAKWDNDRAKRAYYGALNGAVDTIITTPNIADLPLSAHHPYLRPLFQFRAFNFAAQQAILMRGLQDPVANFIGGMVALTTIGMAGAYFRAIANNRLDQLTDKGPDYMIVKGLDNSGLFSILFDVNNIVEKGLGIGAYMATGGDPGAFQDKSFVSSLMGPTGDFVDTLSRVASHAAGGNLRPSDVNAIKNLTPFAGLPYVSAPLNYLIMPKLREAVQ